MIAWRNVDLSFGDHAVFRGWNANVEKGERVVVRGESGAGKSSLVAMALGFLKPDSGEVVVGDRTVTDDTVDEIRRQLAWLPQSVPFAEGTVRENIRDILSFKANAANDVADSEIDDALKRLRLPAKIAAQRVSDISGGELQRVGVATVLLLRRPIYLLDEPTSALDDDATAAVRGVLSSFDEKTTIVVIAHGGRWDGFREVHLS